MYATAENVQNMKIVKKCTEYIICTSPVANYFVYIIGSKMKCKGRCCFFVFYVMQYLVEFLALQSSR